MTAITKLAAFVAAAPRDHQSESLALSQRALVDTLGCMFAGADKPVTRSALAACQAWGNGDAPVVSSAVGLPPPFAALVNGAAAHALDYDDYDVPTNAHPSAVIFPALFAIADRARHSGHDLLDAHIVGVEIMQRLGEAMNMDHYRRGWHSTLTLGGIGAAAACARLNGFAADTAGCALSLATSMSSGLNNQLGFTAKQLHAGLAAKNAVMAAQLAASGVTGTDQALDGPVSLATVMGQYDEARFEAALGKLGKPWSILEHGLITKPYPSCGYTHRVIDAALELQAAHRIDEDAIDSIFINVPDFYLDLLIYNLPTSPAQAMFSAPYSVAAALLDGNFNLASLTDAKIHHPAVRTLCERTTVTGRSPLNTDVPFTPDDPDCVTLVLRNGESLEAKVSLPHGAPGKPVSDADMAVKFTECAGERLGSAEARRIYSLVQNTAQTANVAKLLDAITAPSNAA